MNINLNGRVAIITGATGGIGCAIAKEFYDSGATVVLNGRSKEKLETLAHDLVSGGTFNEPKRIKCVPLDLTADDATSELVNQTVNQFKKVDILVNNAASIKAGLIIKTDKKFLERMMLMNYTVPYLLTREALWCMKKQKWGRIINMTSVSGQYGDRGMGAYGSSKSALTSFAKTVAAEYGRYCITANCVAPGVIDTPSTSVMKADYKSDVIERIPVKRLGKPSEVAALIVFLASERAAYINGQEIAINGGLYR